MHLPEYAGMGADTINTINTILCELTWQKFYFILISMRGRTINLTHQRFWRISDGEIKNCPCSNLFYAPSLWVWPLESALSLRGIGSTGLFQCWLFLSPIDINSWISIRLFVINVFTLSPRVFRTWWSQTTKVGLHLPSKQERTISEACVLTHFVSQMFNSFQWPRR